MKETGHPVVLTINGKAELVVQDTASYQKLIELAERAERMEALQASINDMRAGKVFPVEDMLTEMRQTLVEGGTVTLHSVRHSARGPVDVEGSGGP